MDELVVRSEFMPAMSIEDVATRRNTIVEFTKKAMTQDVDFGVIPGTTKKTLLKPGAEKLCTLFGLSPRFVILRSIEDWTGKDFNGEPFFYYLYHCALYRNDYLLGEGDGSCNSRESKYRYRESKRVCPICGKDTIIRGKTEYGGGWLCFAKKGGCGTKFLESDKSITEQPIGRVANEDIADQANTILKMSQKRALIAATLIAVNASEFFTQDMEDMVIDGEYTTTSVSATPIKSVEQTRAHEQTQVQQQPEPQTSPTESRKPRQPKIMTRNYSAFVKQLVAECPYYAQNGEPNTYHIINTIGKLGYAEIIDENLDEIRAMLKAHAEQAQAEKA